MLPGLSGSLVSEYFAEQILPARFAGETGEDGRDRAWGRLRRWHRTQARALGPVSTARVVFDLAAEPIANLLEYRAGAPRPAGHGEFLVSPLDASADAGSQHEPRRGVVPLLLCTAWGEDLGATWREAVRQSSAAGAGWCLCINGVEARLVDTRRSFARWHVAFSLDLACDNPALFAVFWAICRRAAFLPAAPGEVGDGRPLIDRVVEASGLETAAVCRGLRTGVLDALGVLLSALAGRAPARREPRAADLPNLLEQALTIVYRILFLLFAESRELVPTWHPVYRDSYSMEAVRALAERAGPARGLWETLQAISRLAHAGCHAGDLTVTPFNGRLFAPSLTPAGEHGRVADETARRVVMSLCSTPGGPRLPRGRIAYRDLGVEQLGSVYESVLDYRAVRDPPAGRVRLEAGAGVRKATGTFYTPQSITGFVVRRTLSPLVATASPEQILDLRVVDPAMGSGAFLVAACRYLASAYEAALVRDARCRPGDVRDDDRRGFRRLVASRCLYGVDLNPMAVQLARLSLWLSTLAPDRPLTFFDHRLLAGDSLVGASLDDIARRPWPAAPARKARPADAPLLALLGMEGPGPALEAVLPVRDRVAIAPDDTIEAVREKERLLASVSGASSPLARWKLIADAWCALGLGVGSDEGASPPAALLREVADHLLLGRSTLPGRLLDHWLRVLQAAASARRFFHWTLEFPEVFFAPDGTPRPDAGFDAVLGNPPWDMLRDDNPGAVSGASGDESGRLARFARSSGLYRALGDGHVNRFQLFAERALRLVRRGGRVGLVLPWGLASDAGCGPLRRLLFDTCTMDSLVCFDNSGAIFPIHRSVRFVLLTAAAAGRTTALPCRIGERDPAVLDALPDVPEGPSHGPLVLTRDLLSRVSGEDLAIPDVRSAADLALLEKLDTHAPPLGSRAGWGAEFGRELNVTGDRRHFTDDPRGIPVLEGKHVQPFRAQAPHDARRLPLAAARLLYARTGAFLRPRLAYRDVASATNRLTLIAAMVPAGVATVHTLFCLRGVFPAADQWFLCGALNSFVANYLVRLRVTTHVTAGIIARLPVPRPPAGSPLLARFASLAMALSSSPAPEEDERYPQLQAEVARLYGLTEDELGHVLGTFPLIDTNARERTMKTFVDSLIC